MARTIGAPSSPGSSPVSVYGGYFGAGLGVLVLGVISVGTGGDYRSANVTKNLVVGINSGVVAVFFALNGVVAWPQALVMMAGVPLGALARLADRARAAERRRALASGRDRRVADRSPSPGAIGSRSSQEERTPCGVLR